MYNIVLTNYGNTQISSKVILDGVILLSDYISNISTVTSVTGYSVKLDIPARGNVKDKIGNILIRDDSTNTYVAKTILFYKNVNSEKKLIAGFSQNSAIINKLNKAINLFLSFDFSVFTNGFQFALVQAGFSQASQNVDGLVHIEDPNVEFDDSYSVYSKAQIDNKLSSYAQISSIPTKVSQLDNDSNFINQHQSIKTINNQSLVGTGNIAISQGEHNKINTISVNNTNQTPDSNKNVNITVPTKVSQLDNDLGFITSGIVPTNYVTVNTAQDITAAKTFKNNTDTTKIDGKEIIISGTSDFFTDYNTQAAVTNVPIINKLSSDGLSYDNNDVSLNYHREYHSFQSGTGTQLDYSKGILLRSEYSGTGGNDPSSEYSIYIASQHTNKDYNLGGIYFRYLSKGEDNVIQPENIISINASGVSFYNSTNFDRYVYFNSNTYLNPDNLQLSNADISYMSLTDYVKQASLYYNRTNSVITSTSDTVIEPSSNNAISLGTSTNKFSNIYATTFNGDLNGNASSATTATNADHATSANTATTADSATKATQDGNGNTISSYYCTLSTEQTISGKKTFNGGDIDFVLGDNDRNISFRYSPTYTSWMWITCSNGLNASHIKLHFTNNNTDVIQLTHNCTSESVNNVQTVTSLATTPSVDNVWQLGSSDKRLKYIYAQSLGASNKKTDSVYTSALFADNIGDYDNAVALMYANKIGLQGKQVQEIYVDHLGSQLSKVKTMHISGGHSSHYITIDNSGGEPTIAPDTSNYGYLGTSSKHWYNAYINNLYIGSDGVTLSNYIINLLSGTSSTSTAIGSIRVIRIIVNNKDSDTTIFSAGSNVSGYTIYLGSLANGSFNYSNATLTGTWKLLSELMTPSGIGGGTYDGSLYAIAIRVA